MSPEESEIAPHLSVVIPTWNGLHLLQENLPSILTALERFESRLGRSWELIIVDDASRDATAKWVEEQYPWARLIRRPENGGFSKACNTGFEACRGQVVALLNNDLQPEAEYFVHLYPHFRDDAVFAVTARVFEWDSPIFAAGGRVGRFRRGLWGMHFNYDVQERSSQEWIEQHRLLSACAIGGFAGYSRSKLERVGGFNELLSPFYWEDIDLSYRGWKRGWEVHYEPRSRARHQISSTIHSNYATSFVEMISLRNRLLSHWINLHSPSYLLRHLCLLVALLATRFLVLDLGFYRAFFGALKRLGPALVCRRIEKTEARRSDVELSELLEGFCRAAPIQIFRNQEEVIRAHAGAAADPLHGGSGSSI